MGHERASLVAVIALTAASLGAHAASGCDSETTASLRDASQQLASLREDKPGQMRVFAADGAEFSAGTVRWMRAGLRGAARACARGDANVAAARLTAVAEELRAHRHP